jgi:hypothetical protein
LEIDVTPLAQIQALHLQERVFLSNAKLVFEFCKPACPQSTIFKILVLMKGLYLKESYFSSNTSFVFERKSFFFKYKPCIYQKRTNFLGVLFSAIIACLLC